MNVEIRTEAAQFLEKKYINGILVAVLPTSLSSYLRTILLPFPCLYFHLLFSSSRLIVSSCFSYLFCHFSFFPSLSQYFLSPPCTCLSLNHSSPFFLGVSFLLSFYLLSLCFFDLTFCLPLLASGGISLPIAHLSPSVCISALSVRPPINQISPKELWPRSP